VIGNREDLTPSALACFNGIRRLPSSPSPLSITRSACKSTRCPWPMDSTREVRAVRHQHHDIAGIADNIFDHRPQHGVRHDVRGPDAGGALDTSLSHPTRPMPTSDSVAKASNCRRSK
jgi:hypothetical protein